MPGPAGKLERLAADCREAWPAIGADPRAFLADLAERLPQGAEAEEALDAIEVRDLYLAWACVAGDPAALEAFDRAILSQVPAFVARVDSSPAFADEVLQEVRETLLVAAAGKPAGLSRYTGSGELGGFVRVVAVRAALRLRRRRQPGHPSSQHQLRAAEDPELDYLKVRYRPAFEQAFAAALASLSTREKLLLKLHAIDGLGIDKIAAIYRLHRSTAARRLAGIRRKLRERTQRELQQRLRLTPAEFESLLTLVRSQLWVSLGSALQR
jgi:RNA polymerase sigma-70 factor (ECF subfamily)